MINFKGFLQILFKTILLLLIINEKVLCDNFPIVKLPEGKVQGTLLKNKDGVEYEAFLGIPYAKPPIGDLRFKEAVPITKWPGTFNATNYGSDCLQYSHFSYGTLGSEDCLFVNVFKPVDRTKNPQYDVVVNIHGGAFLFLAGKFFGPGKLINHDFIYVSLNYRLGPLGFMSTGDKVLPGNLGLKDQNLALKWVKNNIKYFNGNENKIIISGLSAGGVSVHYHMLSPRSKGLFHGAMSASGTGLDPWAFTEDVPKKTKILAQRLGCPTKDSETIVKCLNTRPAEQIAAETAYFMGWLYSPFTPFGPTVEPEDSESPFLPRHPYDLIKDGQAAQVPWLVSFTTEEGLYPAAEFLDDAVLMKQLEDNWYEIAPHLLDYNYTVSADKRNIVTDIITKYYLKDKKITEGVKELVQMVGDRLFGAGIVQSVLLQAATSDKEKAPIYLYHFGYRGFYSGSQALSHAETPTDHGVCHADDCGYVLDSPIFNMEQTEDDRKMGERMQNLWVSFLRTGTPYFYENEPLPKVQDGEAGKPLKYLHIKTFNEATVENKDDLAEFYFWSTLPLNERLKLPRQIKQIQDEL